MNSQIVQDIIIAIGLIGGTALYFRSRLPRQTIKDLQDHSLSQDLIIQDLRAQLADVNGQLKIFKAVPLQELADGIRENNKLTTQIRDQLASSANIASASANDGGLLVKTKPNTPVTVRMEDGLDA